jgi:hypothetical protein
MADLEVKSNETASFLRKVGSKAGNDLKTEVK